MFAELASATNWPSILSGTGSFVSGISELILAVGAGIGFFVRNRKQKAREHQRIEEAAAEAAKQTRDQLEAKVEERWKSQTEQLQSQLDDLQKRYDRLLARFLKDEPTQ